MDELKKLYDNVYSNGQFTGTFDEFLEKYKEDSYVDRVFNAVSSSGSYTKSKEEFKSQYALTPEVVVEEEIENPNQAPKTEADIQRQYQIDLMTSKMGGESHYGKESVKADPTNISVYTPENEEEEAFEYPVDVIGEPVPDNTFDGGEWKAAGDEVVQNWLKEGRLSYWQKAQIPGTEEYEGEQNFQESRREKKELEERIYVDENDELFYKALSNINTGNTNYFDSAVLLKWDRDKLKELGITGIAETEYDDYGLKIGERGATSTILDNWDINNPGSSEEFNKLFEGDSRAAISNREVMNKALNDELWNSDKHGYAKDLFKERVSYDTNEKYIDKNGEDLSDIELDKLIDSFGVIHGDRFDVSDIEDQYLPLQFKDEVIKWRKENISEKDIERKLVIKYGLGSGESIQDWFREEDGSYVKREREEGDGGENHEYMEEYNFSDRDDIKNYLKDESFYIVGLAEKIIKEGEYVSGEQGFLRSIIEDIKGIGTSDQMGYNEAGELIGFEKQDWFGWYTSAPSEFKSMIRMVAEGRLTEEMLESSLGLEGLSDVPLVNEFNQALAEFQAISQAYKYNYDPTTIEKTDFMGGIGDGLSGVFSYNSTSNDERRAVGMDLMRDKLPEVYDKMSEEDLDEYYEQTWGAGAGQMLPGFAEIAAEFYITRKIGGAGLEKLSRLLNPGVWGSTRGWRAGTKLTKVSQEVASRYIYGGSRLGRNYGKYSNAIMHEALVIEGRNLWTSQLYEAERMHPGWAVGGVGAGVFFDDIGKAVMNSENKTFWQLYNKISQKVPYSTTLGSGLRKNVLAPITGATSMTAGEVGLLNLEYYTGAISEKEYVEGIEQTLNWKHYTQTVATVLAMRGFSPLKTIRETYDNIKVDTKRRYNRSKKAANKAKATLGIGEPLEDYGTLREEHDSNQKKLQEEYYDENGGLRSGKSRNNFIVKQKEITSDYIRNIKDGFKNSKSAVSRINQAVTAALEKAGGETLDTSSYETAKQGLKELGIEFEVDGIVDLSPTNINNKITETKNNLIKLENKKNEEGLTAEEQSVYKTLKNTIRNTKDLVKLVTEHEGSFGKKLMNSSEIYKAQNLLLFRNEMQDFLEIDRVNNMLGYNRTATNFGRLQTRMSKGMEPDAMDMETLATKGVSKDLLRLSLIEAGKSPQQASRDAGIVDFARTVIDARDMLKLRPNTKASNQFIKARLDATKAKSSIVTIEEQLKNGKIDKLIADKLIKDSENIITKSDNIHEKLGREQREVDEAIIEADIKMGSATMDAINKIRLEKGQNPLEFKILNDKEFWVEMGVSKSEYNDYNTILPRKLEKLQTEIARHEHKAYDAIEDHKVRKEIQKLYTEENHKAIKKILKKYLTKSKLKTYNTKQRDLADVLEKYEKLHNVLKNKKVFGVDGVSIRNKGIYINKDAALKARQGKNYRRTTVVSHEILHVVLQDYFQNSNNEVTFEGMEIIDDFRARLSPAQTYIVNKRIEDNYGNQFSKEQYYDEYFNVFIDHILSGEIKFDSSADTFWNKFRKSKNEMGVGNGEQIYNLLKAYAKDSKRGILRQEFIDLATSGAKEVFEKANDDSVNNDLKLIAAGKSVVIKEESKEIEEKKKEPVIKLDVENLVKPGEDAPMAARSEYLSSFVNQAKNWLKENQDVKDSTKYKEVEENLKTAFSEITKSKRYSKSIPGLKLSRDLSKEQIEKANKDMESFMNALYEENSDAWNYGGSNYVMDLMAKNKLLDKFIIKLVRKTVAHEKPPGWTSESEADLVQQTYVELIPHITNFNKEFHDFKKDAIENDNFWGWVNTYMKRKLYNSFKEIGLKPKFELDITEAKDVMDIETVIEQKEDREFSLRKKLGLGDKFKQKVFDKVKSVFKGKLPHPSSPKFKTQLEKDFEVELFNTIREDAFGFKWRKRGDKEVLPFNEVKYDKFIKDNFLAIYEKLPLEVLNKMTNLETGESMVKVIINPKTGKQHRITKTKTSQPGVFLKYTKAELTEIIDGKEVVKQEFLDYFINPKASRKNMRMEGLAKVLSKEIAFDATMEALSDPAVFERITDVYEMQNIDLLGNELQVISKNIDRTPGMRFSSNIKEVLGIPIEELQKASMLQYGEDYFSDADILTKMSREVIPYIASKKHTLDQAIQKYPNLNEVLKILYNDNPEAFSPPGKDNPNLTINNNLKKDIDKGNASNSKDRELLNKAIETNANEKNTDITHDLIVSLRKLMSNDLRAVLGKSSTTFFKNIFSFTHTTRASRLTNIINDNKKWEEFISGEFEGVDLSKSDLKLIEKLNPYISGKGVVNKIVNTLLSNKSISEIKEDLKSEINFTEINRANGKVFDLILENLYSTLYNSRNKIGFLNNEWVGFANYIKGQSQIMSGLKSLVSLDFIEIKKFIGKNVIKFKKAENVKRRIDRAYESQKLVVEGLLKNKKQISNPNKSKDGTYISNGWKYGVEDGVRIKMNKNGTLSNVKEEITTEPNMYVNSKSEQELYEGLEEAWGNVKNKKELLFKGEIKNEELSDAWLNYRKLRDEVVAHHIKVLPRQKMNIGKYERLNDVKGNKYNLPDDITGSKGGRKGDLVDNVIKDINELDIVISEEAIKFQLEHMNAISKGFSEIITTFSRGLSNDMKLNDVKNNISDIRKSLTAGLFEKSTSKKLDSKLSPTTPLGDIRVFVLENFKDIYNTTELKSISGSKNYLVAKQFLNNINNAKRKVKTKNDNLVSSSKSIKPNKSMTNDDILSLAATMDAALDIARDTKSPTKKIRVFDFDDTLARTKSNVLYTMPNGKKGKLTAEEFAKKGDAMAAKGAKWDFSEFNKVMQGKKGPLFELAQTIERKRGADDIYVLTARGQEAAGAIQEFLESIGLPLKLENIVGLGSSSPYAKSQWVVEKAADGYNDFYFADDHVANVKAVQDALDQLTGMKSKTQIAIVDTKSLDADIRMSKSINSTNEIDSDGLLGIRFSKNDRNIYEKYLLKRRTDLTKKQISENVNDVFKFIDTNPDIPQNKRKKFEKLALHYLANSYLILPEDGYKVIAAEKVAKEKKIDPFSYENPNEIMEMADGKISKEDANPDKIKTFTKKKEYKDGVVVYNVENSRQGQLDTRKVIDANFGEKANPWCLAARTKAISNKTEAWAERGVYWNESMQFETKELRNDEIERLKDIDATYTTEEFVNWDKETAFTISAEFNKTRPHPYENVMFEEIEIPKESEEASLNKAYNFWKQYGKNKKIAFQNDKLIAFRDGTTSPKWWDRMDEPFTGVPSKRKGKEGWTENIEITFPSGKEKLLYSEKGKEDSDGRYIKKLADGTIVTDLTTKGGKMTDGVQKMEGPEGGTITSTVKNGNTVKRVYDVSMEAQEYGRKAVIIFKDKKHDILLKKEVRIETFDTKERLTSSELIQEGMMGKKKITYKRRNFFDEYNLMEPLVEYKEFNGERYLTEYDIASNEIIKELAIEGKGEGTTMTTKERMNRRLDLDRSRHHLLDNNLENKIVYLDKNNAPLRFSMDTRRDLKWEEIGKGKDSFINSSFNLTPSRSYRTRFKLKEERGFLEGNEYEIVLSKLAPEEAAGALGMMKGEDLFEVKGEYYNLDFGLIAKDGFMKVGIEKTGNAFKVMSIVSNGVIDFIKKNNIDGIYFNSGAESRTKVYKKLSKMWADELGFGLGMRGNDFSGTDFLISKDLPVKNKFDNQRAPVRDVLNVVDRSSNTQFERYSIDLNKSFNEIIEAKTGIAAGKTFDDIAKGIGKKKGKGKFFIPYSAEDFTGLIYPLLSKGKKGDSQMEWFKTFLYKPFARAMENISRDRNQLATDFKALKKNLKDVPKDLKKEALPGLTYENAVRIYLWDKQGFKIPNLKEKNIADVWKLMQDRPELQAFADQLLEISKGDGFAKPDQGWMAGTMTTDLLRGLNTTKRQKYLEEWQTNSDIIFSKENLLKLEAAYGYKYVEALRDSLRRMKTGVNKKTGGNRLESDWLNFVNNSVGVTMFFNTRSAVLQTISAINFINWKDNNALAAGKAFANQPQYWKDFMTLINSEFLIDRRNGLRINVSESEIAEAAKTSTNKVKGVISYILQKGFLPTQFADSFAIASGGATFYRNRVKTYMKEGMPKEIAEKKAFEDFREIAEESQQSSRPDKISQQQASGIGRVILAFANTPMQYSRIIKRSITDLRHGRGDAKTHVSRIIYYGTIQNIIFNALQQGLFALLFDDQTEDQKNEKYINTANGMIDSILRGLGYGGAVVAMAKNLALDVYDRAGKDRPEYAKAALKALDISPPIDSKITKLRSAGSTLDYEMDEIKAQGYSLDNPAYLAAAQVISAATNVPLDRVIKKYQNVEAALTEDLEMWQRVAMMLGWSEWQIQTAGQVAEEAEEKAAKTKAKRKATYQRKKKEKQELYWENYNK